MLHALRIRQARLRETVVFTATRCELRKLGNAPSGSLFPMQPAGRSRSCSELMQTKWPKKTRQNRSLQTTESPQLMRKTRFLAIIKPKHRVSSTRTLSHRKREAQGPPLLGLATMLPELRMATVVCLNYTHKNSPSAKETKGIASGPPHPPPGPWLQWISTRVGKQRNVSPSPFLSLRKS